MGLFCEERKVKGREGGARGPRKGGVTGKREVAASPPYRLSLPETVHFFTMGDKVLWILMLRVKEHGSRGITGCRDLKGGAWRKAPKKRRSGYV